MREYRVIKYHEGKVDLVEPLQFIEGSKKVKFQETRDLGPDQKVKLP